MERLDPRTVGAVEWRLVNYMNRCAESVNGSIMDGSFDGDVRLACAIAYKLSDRCEHIAQEALNQLEGREKMLADDYKHLAGSALPYLRKLLPHPWVDSLPSDSDISALGEYAIAAGVPIPS